MRLVIDTNRVMAGLLKDSTSRRIILHRSFSFFAPDYIETELFKHRLYLMKKAKVTTEDFDLILVPFEDFESEYQHAIEVMKAVDENDAPFLAVGIALGIGHIWTEDRHFQKQDLIRVCSTHDLIGMI
jgi:predicted nucleic acid-binding protein